MSLRDICIVAYRLDMQSTNTSINTSITKSIRCRADISGGLTAGIVHIAKMGRDLPIARLSNHIRTTVRGRLTTAGRIALCIASALMPSGLSPTRRLQDARCIKGVPGPDNRLCYRGGKLGPTSVNNQTWIGHRKSSQDRLEPYDGTHKIR